MGAAAEVHAIAGVAADDIPLAGKRLAADQVVVRRVVNAYAAAGVGYGGSAKRVGANIVAGDLVEGGGRAINQHAVAQVAADDVLAVRLSAANQIVVGAAGEHDAAAAIGGGRGAGHV